MSNWSRELMMQSSGLAVSRRTLLKRTAVGLGGVAFLPLLAACEVDDDDVVDDADPAAPVDDDDDDVDDADPEVEDDDDDDDVVDDDPVDDEDDDEVADVDEGVIGGTLVVARPDPQPSLDVQSDVFGVREAGLHVFETLIAYGEDYSFQPGLAATWEWDDEGTVITLGLRDDVVFHNGDNLVADDVIASIERYMEAGSRGVIEENVESLSEIDDYTIDITIAEPNAGFVPLLASPLVYLAILPREHIEGKGRGEIQAIEDLVGTGPYQVDVWTPEDELELVRFDDYYHTEGERDGYSGAKIAYFDRIVFTTVPESGTRISGLLAGDSDYVTTLPRPELSRLETDPDVEPVIGGPGVSETIVFNHHEDSGWSADVRFRQAVQARVDIDELARLMLGGQMEFADMNPSIYRSDQDAWWSDAGAELWNQNDPDRARELLDEAGYDGEEITIIYNAGSDVENAMVTGLTEQLEEIGVNISTIGTDSSTKYATQDDAEGWHIMQDNMTLRFTPFDWDATLACETLRAHWCNDDMQAAFEELRVTFDEDEQKRLSDGVQRAYYEHVFALKLHDSVGLDARRSNIQGVEPWHIQRFWGVWREE